MSPVACAPPLADPVERFSEAIDRAVEVVAKIGFDRAHDPTPCDRYNVAGLIGHLVFAMRRVERLGLGIDAFAYPPDVGVANVSYPWARAVREAGADALAAWQQADLSAQLSLPWMTGSAERVLGMYVMEVLAHAWDLARATAQPLEGDAALGEAVLALAEGSMVSMPMSAYEGPDAPFKRPTTPREGAGPHTRFAALLGRSA
jgi:uncharacterized protein (TIGR03086 family)